MVFGLRLCEKSIKTASSKGCNTHRTNRDPRPETRPKTPASAAEVLRNRSTNFSPDAKTSFTTACFENSRSSRAVSGAMFFLLRIGRLAVA